MNGTDNRLHGVQTQGLAPTARLFCGDCLDVMALLPSNSVDSVVTDPPYHFASIVKRFGAAGAAPAQHGTDGLYARASRGFMGKEWDGGDIAFRPETWAEAWRVLKPGGHLVAFGAPKNYHRLACAIEDARFEIRDSLMWLFGTGFPKSHNLDGAYQGWGTALKPAFEPIVLARKPLVGTVAANVLAHGVGALNVDACRIGSDGGTSKAGMPTGAPTINAFGDGLNTASFGVAVPGLGRWPANVLHDGSDEVVSGFPDSSVTGLRKNPDRAQQEIGATPFTRGKDAPEYTDSGSASRFFYCAKASKADRIGSKHPTVKPQALMRWLCKLITPPGGTILDPFAGSGSTGAAALAEGFHAILIEREAEYQADIRRRLGLPEPSGLSVSSVAAPCNEGIFA